MTERFIQTRLQQKKYIGQISATPVPQYRDSEGWSDFTVGSALIFSHRNTRYTAENFTEQLHAHDYYELTFYWQGAVEYVSENTLFSAAPNTVFWVRPGVMHTTRLRTASRYERYILYFTPAFFEKDHRSITAFMGCAAAGSRTLSAETAAAVSSLLERIERTLQSQKSYGERLARALLTEVFDLLNSAESTAANGVELGDLPASVKQYIDTHYAEIGSIHEVADRFFYSREHLSRLFQKAFNISAAQYLTRKRILEALPLLAEIGATEAGRAVGFRNHLTFINAFKKTMGCLPSEYHCYFKDSVL